MSRLNRPSGTCGPHHMLIPTLQVTAIRTSIRQGSPSARWKSKTTGLIARTWARDFRLQEDFKTLSILTDYAAMAGLWDGGRGTKYRARRRRERGALIRTQR